MTSRRLLPVAAVALLLLAGCGGTGGGHGNTGQGRATGAGGPGLGGGSAPSSLPSGGSAGSLATGRTTWIIERTALNLLYQSGMSEQELQTLFGNENTFVVGGFSGAAAANGLDISGWSSRRTVTSTDIESAPSVPQGATALLYDDEQWTLTPLDQQQDPTRFEQQADQLAKGRGLVLIATPALDLVQVLDPNGSGSVTDRFLQLDIIGNAARNADVVDIQAQGMEGTPKFAAFVTAAAQQARAANPNVKVLAGLSTNPSGHQVSAQALEQAAQSVAGVVDGYWLNIPATSTACPRCGTPQPQVAVPWLEQLAQSAQ